MKKKAISIFLSVLFIISSTSGKSVDNLKRLIHCPAGNNDSKTFSKASYKAKFPSVLGGQTLMGSGEPNIIEINSDITTNQIWTANNVYWITVPINVQALLVIEPGTIVMFGDDYGYYDCGININNGGTLISAGTPDNPIVYTSDSSEPSFGDYFCPIYIEETASPCTKIIYNIIEYAYYAIVTNNIRLDAPIENNILFYNEYGIYENGTHHSDIINNLICGSYYDSINVYMESVSDTADANSYILIENNTCHYYQDYGITVHGVENEADAGLVTISNNIVSGAYQAGLNLVDGYMMSVVTNTGYYDNKLNKNWEFQESNPVEAIDNPYIFGAGNYDVCFLNQACPFIDAGLGYIEETTLVGKTTDLSGLPDSNKIDLGFHHPNWYYSNAGSTTLQADFDNNLVVDINDLAFFLNFWLYDYYADYQISYWDLVVDGKVDTFDLQVFADYWLIIFDFNDFASFANQWLKEIDERDFDKRPDLNKDGVVDFKDFAVFANEWGKTADAYPAISISINGDSNNLRGEIGVSVTGCSYSTLKAYIFMDGQLMGETDYREDEGSPGITINTPSYLNGSHSLKCAVIDHNSLITLSGNLTVDFNNPLHCLSLNDTYEPNQPLRLLGLITTDNNLMVKLSKWDEETIWSQQTSGNLDLNIPGSVLAGQIYDLSIEQEISGMLMLNSSWEPIWERAIAARYDLNKSYKFAIFLPTAWSYFPVPEDAAKSRKKAVAGIINGCETMGIKYIVLYKSQCTWENFARVLLGQKHRVLFMYIWFPGVVTYLVMVLPNALGLSLKMDMLYRI